MANITITRLPNALPLTGTESVPIVQNGQTVQTTTAAISSSPNQQQTFLTVNQEATLPNSRYISTGTGLGLTDGGAQSYYRLTLNAASGSLETALTGIVVKDGSASVIARTILTSNSGLSITNGSGVSGNPTLSLTGLVLNLANASGAGFIALDGSGALSPRQITGTATEINVANGTGAAGNPVISMADTAVAPGTYGSSTEIPVVTVDSKGRITTATVAPAIGGGTVTSVSALTLGTTGTDLSSTVANSTTTPVITLNVPTASAANRGALSAADWTIFNNKGSGTVTGVTGTAPVVSSGGAAPAISMPQATTSVDGYLSATDWTTFNNKGSGTVASVSVVSANGLAGTVATATTTPAITLSTTITGLLKGNGTAISAATSGTDYAPATSGSSILYGNAAGGFSNVTIGTGVAFAGGTLSATGTGGTVTSVTGTAPVVSSGGATPAISMAAATTSVNGYLTSTDWTTFNSKQPAGTYVNSVSGTAGRITSTGGVTPVIDLASGVASAGTTGSASLIPVVTIDTYGRVTTITTAANPQGTVTSVAALTLGTTGTDLSSTVATGTTTPVITLQVPTASASNRGALSAADWTTFNNKGSGTVTSVTGTAPVVSSGGTTPAISMAAATTSVNGYLTSTDWTTFNNKQAALVSGTNIKTVNGTTLLGAGDLGTITYAYGGTGLTSYTAGDIIYASAANTVAKLAIGTTGQRLVVAAGLPSWATDTTVGTVTSVSFTGGIITVATATTTPALTVAGTSGGIPYFSSASTWATSAALTANAIILGGGAGAAPTVLGSLGTTTTVLHGNASGAPTFGAVSLTADVSGTLPIANGGTNSTATATAGGAGYGTGTAHAYTAAGTAGQVLTSAGASAPVWSGIAGGTF